MQNDYLRYDLNTSMTQFVEHQGGSTRLKNAIKGAEMTEKLPHKTIGDYYSDSRPPEILYARLPNIGKGTIRELVGLLDSFKSTSKLKIPQPLGVHEANLNILNESITNIISSKGCSVRLTNAIRGANLDGIIPHQTLKEYIEDSSALEKYQHLPNIGKKTLIELKKVIASATSERLLGRANPSRQDNNGDGSISSDPTNKLDESSWSTSIERLGPECKESKHYLQITAKALGLHWPLSLNIVQIRDFYQLTLDELRQYLKGYVHDTTQEFAEYSVLKIFSHLAVNHGDIVHSGIPESHFENILTVLTARERDILKRRYAIGMPQETLERIGIQLGITRERVRQIEARAKRRLGSSQSRGAFEILLHDYQDRATEILLAESECATQHEILDNAKHLPGEVYLAISCIFGNIEDYADRLFNKVEGIYCRQSHNTEHAKYDLGLLNASLQDYALPQSIEYLTNQLKISHYSTLIYIKSTPGYGIYKEYVYEGVLGSKKQRTIDLHRMICYYYKDIPVDLAELYRCYSYCFPKDSCSIRDLRIVLAEGKHLFVNLSDAGYLGVAQHMLVSTPDLPQFDDIPPLNTSILRPSSHSARHELACLVEEMGPAKLTHIRKEFKHRYYGRWSPNSVYPTLVENPYFVRMAPGIMGTFPMATSPKALIMNSTLFSETQVRIYIYARISESVFNYPLWTPTNEHSWCQWGEKELYLDTFRSLLAVINPESWHVNEQEKARWRNRATKEGYFNLRSYPVPLTIVTPSVRQIFALTHFASMYSHISWLDLNRVLGARIDSRNCLTYIVTLACLGILKLPDNWLMPIGVDQERANWFTKLVVQKGLLSGSWQELGELPTRIGVNLPSYVNLDELDYLIRLITDANTLEPEAKPTVGLDALLEEMEETDLIADITNSNE